MIRSDSMEPDRFLLGESRFSWTDLERIRFLREFLSSWVFQRICG